MANELPIGKQRAGRLVDFDPDTPEVQVTLERTEHGVKVTLGWAGRDNPYAEWFDPNGTWTWRPVQENTAPRVLPKRLIFSDSHGDVLLTGCRSGGYHWSSNGLGSGTIWAHAAILGVDDDVDYANPHGVQTEVSGLRRWLEATSWKLDLNYDDEGRTARIESVRTPPIEIGTFNGIAFEARKTWWIREDEEHDRTTLEDLVWLRTRGTEPVEWSVHMELHHAIRDLLVLSRWREETCVTVHAFRGDDLVKMLDGSTRGEQWRDVIVPSENRDEPTGGSLRHLVAYTDLGIEGIARWISLRNEFARALDPIISCIDLHAHANTLLAHTGPGLEALGYLLLLRDGLPKDKARSATLHERLERILEDISPAIPFHGPTWVDSTVAVYNALKHANRALPDEVDVANAWRESVLATRIWVAIELGVDPNKITERLRTDKQRNAYVRRD